MTSFYALPGINKLVVLNAQDKTFKQRSIVFGLSVVFAVVLGGLLVNVPFFYLAFGVGGLIFTYFLLFKIEVAVIIALLIRDYLEQFDYLGGGTALHPNGLMGIAIIVGTIYFFLFNKIDFSRLPVFGSFLGFVVLCLVSAFPLASSGWFFVQSLTVTIRLATALAIYAVLLYKLESITQLKWVIAAIVLARLGPTIQGIVMFNLGGGLGYTKGKTARLGGGSSSVGAYLAFLAILCLVFFLNAKTHSRRLLWGGLTGIYVLGLLLSFGRAGWIGFAIGLIIIGLMRHIRTLTILPILFLIVITSVPAISQRFSDVDVNRLDDRNSSTLGHRMELWKGALHVYKKSPIYGVGYGIGSYKVGGYLGQRRWALHNDYIMVLTNTGLIGLVIFIVWHAKWLTAILKVYTEAIYEYDKVLALAVFAIFTASLVIRLTDNVLQDTGKLYPLTALIAIVLALPRIRREEALIS